MKISIDSTFSIKSQSRVIPDMAVANLRSLWYDLSPSNVAFIKSCLLLNGVIELKPRTLWDNMLRTLDRSGWGKDQSPLYQSPILQIDHRHVEGGIQELTNLERVWELDLNRSSGNDTFTPTTTMTVRIVPTEESLEILR